MRHDVRSDGNATSKASASTAENSRTPQDAHAAANATRNTSDGPSYWLTQIGWEASMGLPPLTRESARALG